MNPSKIFRNPTHLINLASRTFTKVIEARLRRIGIGIGQVPVLAALKDGHALHQTELARMARVEQPSMAAILKRMERDGLVERISNPDDSRSHAIALTPKAIERIPEAHAIMMQGNDEALEGLSEEEIVTLTSLLERVSENLDRASIKMPSL